MPAKRFRRCMPGEDGPRRWLHRTSAEQVVRWLMDCAHCSPTWIATYLRADPSTISRWLSRKTLPTPNHLNRLLALTLRMLKRVAHDTPLQLPSRTFKYVCARAASGPGGKAVVRNPDKLLETVLGNRHRWRSTARPTATPGLPDSISISVLFTDEIDNSACACVFKSQLSAISAAYVILIRNDLDAADMRRALATELGHVVDTLLPMSSGSPGPPTGESFVNQIRRNPPEPPSEHRT